MDRPSSPGDITQRLQASRQSPADGALTTSVMEVVYDELTRLAAGYMRREGVGHTLQPTALVHEAYLRLVDQTRSDWRDRHHFFGIAARVMRQVLVDHARRKGRSKRGGDWRRVTFDEHVDLPGGVEQDVLDLEDALTKLEALDARMAQVVDMRVFGGMTMEDIATDLGVSVRTVHNDWRMARMWLARALEAGA